MAGRGPGGRGRCVRGRESIIEDQARLSLSLSLALSLPLFLSLSLSLSLSLFLSLSLSLGGPGGGSSEERRARRRGKPERAVIAVWGMGAARNVRGPVACQVPET